MTKAWLTAIAGTLAVVSPTLGQDAVPIVTGIVPPGVTVGATTVLTVNGRNLAGVERFLVSGRGVEVVGTKAGAKGTVAVTICAAGDAEPGFREFRAEGAGGISNLLIVRVDRWPQTAEVEPNDVPAQATPIALNSAGYGVLAAQDLDHFRFEGRAGQRVAIEVEARRLGTAIVPVVTLFNARGQALAQGREDRSGNGDCRLLFALPADGTYVVQVRDNMYDGGATARYRVRVGDAPFATGLFPLGGRRGRSIAVEASGGNLAEPRTKVVVLPDTPGAIVEVGDFDHPAGAFPAPMRLVVGNGPEFDEPTDAGSASKPPLVPVGTTINGRIGRPGEVDWFRVKLGDDDRVQIKVVAAALGSWLDSVITVLGPNDDRLAENDDPGNGRNPNQGLVFGSTGSAPDSVIDFESPGVGEYVVEIADRFGEGGPEFAYRLTIGPARPDLRLTLLLGDPNVNRQALFADGVEKPAPGATGSLNLEPGALVPVNFLILPEGRIGTITVRAEGLPRGVSAEPVTVRPARRREAPIGGMIVLKVARDAEGAVGDFRLVARARLEGGATITRVATAVLAINTEPGSERSELVLRSVTHLPVKVIGRAKVGP